MSEEQIKTSEHELRMLIEENKGLLEQNKSMLARGDATFVKMNRTLKGFIATAIPIVLAFFWTFYDNGKTLTRIEEAKVSKTEAESTYAKKTDVVFLQNNIYDMNKSSFVYNPNTDEFRMELSYTRALKQFLGDVSRGLPNQQ